MYNLHGFAGRNPFSSTKHGRLQYINQDFAQKRLDSKAKICLRHVEKDLEAKPPEMQDDFRNFFEKILTRGGVEDTRLEAKAKAKDTKKIQDQGQLFRGQTLSRPRTGMLEAKAKD